MAILRRNPFRKLRDLERQLDDMFRKEESDDTNGSQAISGWSPRVDVYEEGNDLVFELDAPGLHKDDLDVSIEDNRLTIRGERREEKDVEDEDRNYYRSERIYGQFQRSFALPDKVEASEIDASYDDGVLTVRAPQTAESTSESIQIT
ncbi:MAG: Hsp20/alpha crystallin family protein [bacterium]